MDQPIDRRAIYRIIRACPSLLELDDAQCRFLAAFAVLRALDVADIFARDDAPSQVCILARGSAFYYVEHSGRISMRLLRPGALYGMQSIDALVRRLDLFQGLPVPMSTWNIVLEPRGPIEIIEFPRALIAGFIEMSGAAGEEPTVSSIREALLQAYARLAWLFPALDVLTNCSTLRGLRPSRVFDLLDRGRVEVWSPGSDHHVPADSHDLHLVLQGTLIGRPPVQGPGPALQGLAVDAVLKRAPAELEPGLASYDWRVGPNAQAAVVLGFRHAQWWSALTADVTCVEDGMLDGDRVLLLAAREARSASAELGPLLAEAIGREVQRPVIYRKIDASGQLTEIELPSAAEGAVPPVYVYDGTALATRTQMQTWFELLRARTSVYVMDRPEQWRNAPEFLLHPLFRARVLPPGDSDPSVAEVESVIAAAADIAVPTLEPSWDTAPVLVPMAIIPDPPQRAGGMGIDDFRSDTAVWSRRGIEWIRKRVDQAFERVGLASPRPEYPMNAARIFHRHTRTRVRDREARTQALDRCARAVVGRRTAVVLGGGGALGYAHLALMAGMEDEGVPIDVIIGSSTGTLMGSYQAVLGSKRAIELMRWLGWAYLPAQAAGNISSYSFEWLVDAILGLREQQHTEVVMLPVVTDAWKLRGSVCQLDTVGFSVRASGAYPPAGPAIFGERRMLDGGVFWMDPVGMALSVDATLLVSSSVFPGPIIREPRKPLPIPIWGSLMSQLNPIQRYIDYSNTQFVAARRPEATSGTATANVSYVAEPVRGATVISWFAFNRIFGQAKDSVALNYATQRTRELWRERRALLHCARGEQGHGGSGSGSGSGEL